jgi:hypothetical protein
MSTPTKKTPPAFIWRETGPDAFDCQFGDLKATIERLGPNTHEVRIYQNDDELNCFYTKVSRPERSLERTKFYAERRLSEAAQHNPQRPA